MISLKSRCLDFSRKPGHSTSLPPARDEHPRKPGCSIRSLKQKPFPPHQTRQLRPHVGHVLRPLFVPPPHLPVLSWSLRPRPGPSHPHGSVRSDHGEEVGRSPSRWVRRCEDGPYMQYNAIYIYNCIVYNTCIFASTAFLGSPYVVGMLWRSVHVHWILHLCLRLVQSCCWFWKKCSPGETAPVAFFVFFLFPESPLRTTKNSSTQSARNGVRTVPHKKVHRL